MLVWEVLSQGWCRYARARDKDGNICEPRSPDAVAWDISGAVEKVFGHNEREWLRVMRVIMDAVPNVELPACWSEASPGAEVITENSEYWITKNVPRWQDTQTQDKVVKFVRKLEES